MAVGCLGALLLGARAGFARGVPVLVEVGESAENLLDARATRRLVALELADIDVPASGDNKRARDTLFLRVLQVDQNLRVELWQRGEYHGARIVSGDNARGQLSARRVALAAAELARRLQKKRLLQAARERAETRAQAERAARAARLTLDGPFAVRPSLQVADIGGRAATLFGSRLFGQWTFAQRTRLDAGFAWLAGGAPGGARTEWLELALSPMHRVPLSERLDLDLGVNVAAAWLRLGRVRGVDAIPDQSETWSARAAVVLRLEPSLSRQLRLSIGTEAGLVLRRIPFQASAGDNFRLGGLWLGLDLGVVFTPR